MMIRDLPAAHSIKIGRLYYKYPSINDILTRCVRAVFHESDDRSLPMGFAGSSTLVMFRDNRYIILTRHQIGIRNGDKPQKSILETVRIASGFSPMKNILIDACIFETSNHQEEYHDIIMLRAVNGTSNMIDAPYFIEINGFSEKRRIASFLVGYPLIENSMVNYIERFYEGRIGEILIRRAISECEIDTGFVSHAEYYRRYTHKLSWAIADGYSGGGIFSLIENNGNWEIELDGIVVRANEKYIHIIDADYLRKIIEINHQAQP